MDKYLTISDFADAPLVMALIYSVASAVPPFFAVSLFILWFFGGGASFFAILRFTGKKRFFHVAVAFSFACFIISLFLASMNYPDTYPNVVVLNGYWVAFYILMTGLSYLGLHFYKD